MNNKKNYSKNFFKRLKIKFFLFKKQKKNLNLS